MKVVRYVCDCCGVKIDEESFLQEDWRTVAMFEIERSGRISKIEGSERQVCKDCTLAPKYCMIKKEKNGQII